VVEVRLRLRYTEGGLQAEELGVVVSNPGGRLKGGRRFGGFGAKPSPTPGSGRPRLLHHGVVEMWAHGSAIPMGMRVSGGLGLKTITALFGPAEAWIR